MAQKKNENQKTEKKSSKEIDSVESTIAEVQAALEEGGSEEAAMELLNGKSESTTVPEKEIETDSASNAQAAEDDSEEEDYSLPSTYKKDIRELVKKLPKGYEELGKAFVKRAKEIEKDRQGFYSDYQSKTAFAAKLSKAVEPYFDHWQAKGIVPEIGIQRAAKLDYLVATDPQAAVKFIMQMANVRQASLDDEEVKAIIEAKGSKQGLTQDKPLSQDDIRRIIQEETSRATQTTAATQDNLKVIEKLVSEKAANGKDKYPSMKDDDFVRGMEPLVVSLLKDPSNNLSFEQAVLAAYVSRGGEIEQGNHTAAPSNKDFQKVERLKVASTIRPANSSTNSMSLDDIDIPDSIEETIALAQKLAAGRA